MRNITDKSSDFLCEYLKSCKLMSLGTSDGINMWNSCIYFLSDKWLNLYFMSDICTQHADNVVDHPQVALTVTNSQNYSKERIGVQASGICEVMDEESWPRILGMWNKKFSYDPVLTDDLKKRNLCLFKIILIKLKYFNTNLTEKVLEFDF